MLIQSIKITNYLDYYFLFLEYYTIYFYYIKHSWFTMIYLYLVFAHLYYIVIGLKDGQINIFLDNN